ncbi:MAG: ribosome small subunit-dependent GTPase A [Bdellovibrionota bacterium]
MLSSDRKFLFQFGWDDFFEKQIPELDTSTQFPARVISEERNLYRVQAGPDQIMLASISGKMQHGALTRADYPAVGDWVMIEFTSESDRGIIQHIFQRKSILHRKQVGETTDIQILSTNVDFVFVTTSVNSDLNYRRIERYLAMTRDGGSTPIILLTKSDLCENDISKVIADMEREFPDVPIHPLTKNDFNATDFFADYLQTGTTSVFVGSSGVGKSTLVNFLIGTEQIKTQDIREDDEKGRHTTTSRNLYVSRYGGLIIDTPGMRELQLSDDQAEGVANQFSDLEELMQTCRFSDCRHQTEPGCAIKEGIASQSISKERWQSYQKLQAEVQHGMRKQNKGLQAENKKRWAKLTEEGRKNGKAKKGEF